MSTKQIAIYRDDIKRGQIINRQYCPLNVVVVNSQTEEKRTQVKSITVNLRSELVLVAGLEPARYLYRGILRQMRCEIHKNKNFSKSAKTGRFRTKNH